MHRTPLCPMLIAFGAFVCAGPAPAHHTYAMFDTSRELSVSGVVAKFEWKNPHTYVWVYVPGQGTGKYEAWAFENASPSLLSKLGWSRDSLKPDDRITLIYAPLRDGRPGGHCLRITLPGGRNLACHGFDAAPPAAGR